MGSPAPLTGRECCFTANPHLTGAGSGARHVLEWQSGDQCPTAKMLRNPLHNKTGAHRSIIVPPRRNQGKTQHSLELTRPRAGTHSHAHSSQLLGPAHGPSPLPAPSWPK